MGVFGQNVGGSWTSHRTWEDLYYGLGWAPRGVLLNLGRSYPSLRLDFYPLEAPMTEMCQSHGPCGAPTLRVYVVQLQFGHYPHRPIT